jgi:hypothetical protein
MKRLTASLAFAACFVAFSPAVVLAANPHSAGSTGQPNQSCEDIPTTPGNAAAASGSPFNPDGHAGTVYAGEPGSASALHAGSPHAVSQYDVACFQQP